jgi:hypothetical protein
MHNKSAYSMRALFDMLWSALGLMILGCLALLGAMALGFLIFLVASAARQIV